MVGGRAWNWPKAATGGGRDRAERPPLSEKPNVLAIPVQAQLLALKVTCRRTTPGVRTSATGRACSSPGSLGLILPIRCRLRTASLTTSDGANLTRHGGKPPSISSETLAR